MILQLFSFPIHLLINYGYLALFIWSILEGEIGLMLSGWLASKDIVFDYIDIILIASIGALIGDTLLFIFGYFFRDRALKWLDKIPNRKDRVEEWIERWGSLIIIFERFIYGTHIPAILTIGVMGYSFVKFFIFDIIGILLWSFIFVSVGYYLGDTAINIMILAQKNIGVVILIIAIFIFIKKSIDES